MPVLNLIQVNYFQSRISAKVNTQCPTSAPLSYACLRRLVCNKETLVQMFERSTNGKVKSKFDGIVMIFGYTDGNLTVEVMSDNHEHI